MRTCSKCRESKSEDEFSWKIKDKQKSATCKACHREYRKTHYSNNRQKYIDKARAWEVSKGGRRVAVYGLSEVQLAALLGKYDGLCWICQKKTSYSYRS